MEDRCKVCGRWIKCEKQGRRANYSCACGSAWSKNYVEFIGKSSFWTYRNCPKCQKSTGYKTNNPDVKNQWQCETCRHFWIQ